MNDQPIKKARGFATWTPEQRRAAASKGGKAAQAGGTAHQFTTEEAKAAGRKGGLEMHRRRAERNEAKPPTEES